MQTITSIICRQAASPARADLGGRQLSAAQIDSLIWIAAQTLRSDGEPVPWRHAGPWTASDRASESRTLRRLEERGLIVRLNLNGDGHRTSHVELTEAGAITLREKGLTNDVLTVAGYQ